ncbi:hypothetical protein Glove_428g47 [Diversispora epigaea]|uniref:Arrestin C-terminal-like domain-containing protein n=1 Tax=Diversispora epigaea TaxID=1348612 RepID=A0A397GUM6_9GLOM|nr:hypothetical protein Glove_428g47 [Diversispora epigaea]
MSGIPTKYKKYSSKFSFCYIPGHSQFQVGYLGITESSVSGILDLHFPSDDPVYAKQIFVTLIGEEYAERESVDSTYRARSNLISQGICVWRSPDDTYQQINELQLPFQFELPNYLPSSVKFAEENSKISYNLEAIIKQKSGIFRSSSKSIKIRCPITRYSLPPTILTPIQFSTYDDPSAVSRGIGFSVSIEHNVFSQLIPISIDFGLLFHKPDLKIKKVILGVKQYIKFITSENREKFSKDYVLKYDIKYDKIKNRLDHNNEYKSNVKFEIPPRNDTELNSVRHSIDQRLIKVFHRIKFKVKFGIFGGYNINWEKDIKIENMIAM